MEPLVFISYTSSDRERVSVYYDYLVSKGFNVWIDFRRLKAGQNWDFEIRRALSKASIIIIFISNNSVTKRGYVQREIKLALSKYEEKLSDDIYVVPVVLDDDAHVPEILQDVQFVRESKGNCEEEIEESIKYQLNQLGVDVRSLQENSDLKWSVVSYKDVWDGLPGYELDIGFLNFSSDEYQRITDITDCIKGWLIDDAMCMRSAKFEIDLERYNYGQHKQSRTSTYDAHCSEPTIIGKIIFINYAIHTYHSGAAHPNMVFKTFCFLLDPLMSIRSLREFFLEPGLVFPILQEKVRDILSRNLLDQARTVGSEDDHSSDLYKDWIHRGTENWNDFHSFIMKQDKLEVLFPAYQVASYADGPQVVEIELSDLLEYIKKHLLCALDMEYSIMRRQYASADTSGDGSDALIPPPPD